MLAVAALICAGGWLMEHISVLALLWYIEEKKIPYPSPMEMKKGAQWAAKHLVKSLVWKNKR